MIIRHMMNFISLVVDAVTQGRIRITTSKRASRSWISWMMNVRVTLRRKSLSLGSALRMNVFMINVIRCRDTLALGGGAYDFCYG